MTNAADAAPARPVIEHYGTPTLNGQRLPFSRAVRVGDILYLSGAIGRGPDGKPPEGIEAQTKATMEDIGETLKLAGLSYNRIFHCTVFLSDMKNWAAFNQVYGQYKLAPGITRQRLYIETMEKVLSRSQKIIVDNKGASAPIILPPDAFRPRPGSQSTVIGPSPQVPTNARSRQ